MHVLCRMVARRSDDLKRIIFPRLPADLSLHTPSSDRRATIRHRTTMSLTIPLNPIPVRSLYPLSLWFFFSMIETWLHLLPPQLLRGKTLKTAVYPYVRRTVERNKIRLKLVSSGFDSAVCAALLHKALLQSDDSSRVHDIHIDNGFLRKDESEQVATSL
ncbi:hypothetical protein OUZ56_005138 [Daphnia magna]|uniref:GMPS ATP-PPase domain-containing protein n=1 Tax=Daphnia magna TaxID=35525 RepID=A0ABQ9YS50_9CRUS|nr:hypothetical protein OUZ56_005138 [Daphnia magna]